MSKSIFKNTIYKALLNIFNILIPIIIGPYANRVLGPKLMGSINYADSIYSYFWIFAAFGIYNYGLREISRVRDDKEKVSSLFTSLFLTGLIANIVVSSIYFFFIFLKFRNMDVYPVLAINGISILANIFYVEWANEALEKYDFITIKAVIIKGIYIVFLFTLVRSSDNFIEYVVLLMLSVLLNNLVSFIYIKKNIRFNFKAIKIKKHIKFLLLVIIMSNANVLYAQLDRLSLGSFVGLEQVAFYGMAQNIMSLISTLMLSIIFVTVPRLSNVLANEDETAYRSLLDKICESYFAFLFPAAIGMFIVAREIIYIYGGPKFFEAVDVLKVYSIYMITTGFESILSNQVIYVRRKEKVLVVIIFVFGLVNLMLKALLINIGRLTPVTAIATTCLCNIGLVTTEYTYIRRYLKVNIKMFTLSKFKYLLMSLVFIPVTLGIKAVVSNLILIALIAVAVNGLIYILMLYFTKDRVLMFLLQKLKLKKA